MFVPDVGQVTCVTCIDAHGNRVDNITDWSLAKFRNRYGGAGQKGRQTITKPMICQYVYGVLNDPMYRDKYAINLKQEFPRIPFYADFRRWAEWGKQLMDLHAGYETVMPLRLKRTDIADEKSRKAGMAPKCVLR